EKFDAPVLISVVAGAFQIVVELQLRSLTELNREVLAIRAIKGVREVYVHLYERILSSFFLGTGPDSLSQFDEIDINIVNRLLHDGRASFAELAQVVGLSVSGCRTRVQRLLESGVIQIGAIKQRSDMTNDLVFGIGVNAHDDCREAIDAIAANRGLEFIARTVGRFDLLATVEFDSLRDFNLLVSRLRSLPSVEYCEPLLPACAVVSNLTRRYSASHRTDIGPAEQGNGRDAVRHRTGQSPTPRNRYSSPRKDCGAQPARDHGLKRQAAGRPLSREPRTAASVVRMHLPAGARHRPCGRHPGSSIGQYRR